MGKQNLEAQLATLSIPLFKYPWPEACSPDVEVIEAAMIDWADKHGLFVSSVYRLRVERTRYGYLASRCYPNAGHELLQAIANFIVWFFLIDDLFVDRVEVVTPETVRNLTAMIDVLDFECAGPQPVFGELAWVDVSSTLRGLLGAEAFSRFAQGMRLWASTASLQILNHLNSESVDFRGYSAIRRHTGGVNPCSALSDNANGGSVHPDEFYSSEIQELLLHANNIVCWSNDIQSVGVEIRQPGQFRYMVVIHANLGHTLQESVNYTEARVNAEISQFLQISPMIEPRASERVLGLINGLKYWTRGYQDWVEKDTMRYKAKFAVEDADDRGLLC